MRLHQQRAETARLTEKHSPPHARRSDPQLTVARISILQQLAGNAAVTRVIASARRRVAIQRSEGEGAESLEPWLVEVQSRLTELGVSAKEMGAAESFRALGESEARRLLGKLVQYKSDPGLTFTSSSKVVRTWNARTDDLGVAGRSGYRTILHYVAAMEALANSSLGGSWPDNLKVMRQAIRIGGARFHVHPRMLYFAAAAQVGMNEAAGLASDEGHYLAPAAVFEELRMIRDAAVVVDDLAADVERAHAATGSTDPAPGVEGAGQVYANLAGRLKTLAEIRKSQAMGGTGALDHPEPIARHLDDSMAAAIEALPASAGDDAAAVERCREIMTLTWSRPKKKQAHGWGAADPHGTHHALGMAMDAFYGTAQGGYANSFKFLQGDTAAEIAALVVREYGAGYDLQPSAPKELARRIRTDPEAGRAFALLLKDHAGDVILLFEDATARAKDPETARRLGDYAGLRQGVLKGVRARHTIARRLLSNRATVRATPELRAYIKDVVGTHGPGQLAKHRLPASFLVAAQVATGSYEALRVTLEHGVPPISSPALDPLATPDVATPLDGLVARLDELASAVDAKDTAALKRRMPAGFRRALDRAASGTMVLDQPLEVLRGFASVQGARLQSGHHFQVSGWALVLESKKVYTSKVVADMNSRTPDGVRQILQVMAQTKPGYEAIFGAETDAASILPALREWAGTSGADIAAMLQAVHDQLPPPAMEGVDAKRKQLASDMYDRGFYDVALAVARPGSSG